MKSYQMNLISPIQGEIIKEVVSFTAHDESGSFNILSNASRRMTILSYGLAQFRFKDGKIEYLALPESLVYFNSNELKIVTTHYYRNEDYAKVLSIMDDIFNKEKIKVKETMISIHKLDEEILKRMIKMQGANF